MATVKFGFFFLKLSGNTELEFFPYSDGQNLDRYCMQFNCFQSQIASNGRLVTDDFVRPNNDSNYDVTFASYPGTASLYAVIVSTR